MPIWHPATLFITKERNMSKWICVIVIALTAVAVACIWFPDPRYQVGNTVVINDCTVWSQPTPANGSLAEGVSVASSPGVMMRSGYSVGKQKGIVRSIETVRPCNCGRFFTPIYKYTVEVELKEAPEAGWAVQEQFYENELSKS